MDLGRKLLIGFNPQERLLTGFSAAAAHNIRDKVLTHLGRLTQGPRSWPSTLRCFEV